MMLKPSRLYATHAKAPAARKSGAWAQSMYIEPLYKNGVLSPSVSSPDVRNKLHQMLGPGYATRPELAEYLQIGARTVPECAAQYFLKANRAGKFAWQDIWLRLWRIRDVPADSYELLKSPLLNNADVAALLGLHERSVRRDGDLKTSRYGLPAHLDLSDRNRRHHPLRISYWAREEPMPRWLRPTPAGGLLGLVPRSSFSNDECT